MSKLSEYSKFITALVGAAVAAATAIWGSEDVAQIAVPIISLLTALGVYQVPNQQPEA